MKSQSLHRVRRSGALALLAVFFTASAASWAQGAAATAKVRPPKVAVVLSGGSAFGIAHVGVLEVLEDAGIPVDMILGTSMGSIVGGLYAAGYSPARMAGIVTAQDWNAVFMDSKNSPGDAYDADKRRRISVGLGFDTAGLNLASGLLEGQNILALFTELTLHALPVRRFDDLPVPYRAVAAEALSGDRVIFDSGSIAEAMRSSMSIPGLFRPFEAKGMRLVDGGIVDNLPVELARSLGADIVIAVISSATPLKSADQLKSAVDIAGHTALLMVEKNVNASRKLADLVIQPDLSGYTAASYDEAAALVDKGREGAVARLDDIRAMAAKIGASRPLPRPDEQANRAAMKKAPVISSFEARGASQAQRAAAVSAFSRLSGAPADPRQVRRAIDSVYSLGEFDLVKFDLEPQADGTARGIVTLVPDTTPSNMVFLGVDYRSVFSGTSMSRMTLSPGVVVRGITNPESAFFAEAALVNSTKAYAEFFQPLGAFHLKPWARYVTEHDVYTFANETARLDLAYRAAGGGVQAGLSAADWLDLGIGYRLENVKSSISSASQAKAELGAFLDADSLGRTVFPDRGGYLYALGRWASGSIGSEIDLMRLDVEASGSFRLGSRISATASAFLSTDFYGYVPGATAASDPYYASLRRPGMFYGFTERGERTFGDHAAGAALELRYRVGKLNALLGGELYGVLNASAGTVQTKELLSTALTPALPLRFSFAAGAGARFTDTLGILAAICLNVDEGSATPVSPGFTLEFGSFAPRREDRR